MMSWYVISQLRARNKKPPGYCPTNLYSLKLKNDNLNKTASCFTKIILLVTPDNSLIPGSFQLLLFLSLSSLNTYAKSSEVFLWKQWLALKNLKKNEAEGQVKIWFVFRDANASHFLLNTDTSINIITTAIIYLYLRTLYILLHFTYHLSIWILCSKVLCDLLCLIDYLSSNTQGFILAGIPLCSDCFQIYSQL